MWWAACVPEVAGTDPATLRQKALDLGFSLIPERQEQLPALALSGGSIHCAESDGSHERRADSQYG